MARRRTTSVKNLGLTLTAIYLIVVGLSPFLGIQFGELVNLLAIFAGVMLLIDLR
jgi:hypothetical protein